MSVNHMSLSLCFWIFVKKFSKGLVKKDYKNVKDTNYEANSNTD